MKLRLIADGSPTGTRVIDVDTGRLVRSRRWTWRRFRSARRGARIARLKLVRLMMIFPGAVNMCSALIVPVTFWSLLLAPNRARPWWQTAVVISGHPVESIDAVYFDEERVK